MDSDQPPNTIVRATTLGLQHPTGRDVLGDFVAPYFEVLEPIWKGRTYQIANYLITGLYPRRVRTPRCATRRVRGSTRTATSRALRRLVSENPAGVERALAVQERDAQ